MPVSYSRIQPSLPLPTEDISLVKINEPIPPKDITLVKINEPISPAPPIVPQPPKIKTPKIPFIRFKKADFYYLELALIGFSTENKDQISPIFTKLELGGLIMWEINGKFKKVIVTERGHEFLERWKIKQNKVK